MLRRITNWGGPTFLLALVFLAGGILLSFRFSLGGSPRFYENVLPKYGIGISISLILLCLISYSRIHNSRIYIMGIMLGLNGLAENSLSTGIFTMTVSPHMTYYFQLFLFGCLLLVCMLPGSLKYSTVKNITIGLFFLYSGGFFLGGSLLELFMPLLFSGPGQPQPLYGIIGYGIPTIVVLASFIFLGNQFYLGGVFSGLSVLLSGVWLRDFYLADSASYYFIGSGILTAYMIVGIIIHWIVKVSHNIAIDPLMQIYNRSYCNNIIREQSRVNTSPPLSVIMVDIDHFKKVNDVHGHQAGDTVLKKVAQTLKSSLGSNGILCRYGGEEIIIFISRTSQKQAEAIIEKARLAVKKMRVKVGRKSLKVTISAGISQRLKKSQSVESVISAADKAVYKAKKAGRDRIKTAPVSNRKK